MHGRVQIDCSDGELRLAVGVGMVESRSGGGRRVGW